MSDLAVRVRADFLKQIRHLMQNSGVNQTVLAQRMGVSPSRVSQLMNPTNNVRLVTWVRMVRALGLKMAIVGHDSPRRVSGKVIVDCWEKAGRPTDMWDLNSKNEGATPLLKKESKK